jgi:hypothetical protein
MVIRIIVGMGPRCSCRRGIRKLNILTVPCLYILSLMIFVVNNHNNLETNTSIYDISTRYGDDLHRPVVNHSVI